MGFNYTIAGWTNLTDFVQAMYDSEGQQLRAFLGICRSNHLIPFLQRHQWASFAAGYNGPSYRDNDYDGNMARAYARYARQ
jgi:hypothetical protein